MKIVISNVYDDRNRGSCALTWSAIEFARMLAPGAQLSLLPLSQGPSLNARTAFVHTMARYPDVDILPPALPGRMPRRFTVLMSSRSCLAQLRQHLPRAALDAIGDADLLLSRGGVVMHATPGFAGAASLSTRVLPLLAAKASGVRTLLYGAQVGPVQGRIARRALAAALRGVDLALPRDRHSAATLRSVAPTVPQLVCPDSVFLLEHAPDEPTSPTTDRTLGVVLSNQVRGSAEDWLERVSDACHRLLANGAVDAVRILPQVSADAHMAEGLASLLPSQHVELVRGELSPPELMAAYERCHAVLSSRMHGVVLALLAGTLGLSMPTGRSFREQGVLGEVGLASCCIVEASRGDDLARIVEERLAHRDDHVRLIRTKVEDARRALREAVGRVAAAVVEEQLGSPWQIA